MLTPARLSRSSQGSPLAHQPGARHLTLIPEQSRAGHPSLSAPSSPPRPLACPDPGPHQPLDQSPQWSSSERGQAAQRCPQSQPRKNRKRLWPERYPVPILLLTENINVYILARNPQDFLSR